MLSATTLKYKISAKPSLYAAISVFALYSGVILVLLLIFSISWLTFPLYLLLLTTAAYGAVKAYRQLYVLKLSDSGLAEIRLCADGRIISGIVSTSSFYNQLFVSLHLKENPNDPVRPSHSNKLSVVIYRDAVSESEYRLLARTINFAGR